jgi:hypothetical protein
VKAAALIIAMSLVSACGKKESDLERYTAARDCYGSLKGHLALTDPGFETERYEDAIQTVSQVIDDYEASTADGPDILRTPAGEAYSFANIQVESDFLHAYTPERKAELKSKYLSSAVACVERF